MQISVIFIGHKNNDDGLKRTRRLFSTLNRYSKPVTMDDIIALDEDDSIAIVTRDLLEQFSLFTEKKVTKSKNKAIQSEDKNSFTSIITLYQCNRELLKYFRRVEKDVNPNAVRDKKSLQDYLKFRPAEEDLVKFGDFIFQFWSDFLDSFDCIKEFLTDRSLKPAEPFRNNINGGNLLFRPIGLEPFIQASILIKMRSNKNWKEIFEKFSASDFSLAQKPWLQVLWNDIEKTMIMGNVALTKFLLIYLYDSSLLKATERDTLVKKYASAINFSGENLEDVLNEIDD